MVLAIMEMVADEDEDNNEQGPSTEWISLVDQGGLWHVINETFMFFMPLKRSFATTSQFQPSVNSHLVRKVPLGKPSLGTMMWLSSGA